MYCHLFYGSQCTTPLLKLLGHRQLNSVYFVRVYCLVDNCAARTFGGKIAIVTMLRCVRKSFGPKPPQTSPVLASFFIRIRLRFEQRNKDKMWQAVADPAIGGPGGRLPLRASLCTFTV